MNAYHDELVTRLGELREQGLYRELRRVDSPQSTVLQMDGRSYLNFSSNDYLGLANEPALKEAAIKAVERFGAGSGASRLICGSLGPHHELEEALAEFKGTQGALTFSSGYAAALGTICALMDNNDVIVVDKLIHACVVDAVRLSGAKLRVFGHNNLEDLEKILKWADTRHATPALPSSSARRPRTLIVTESVFSMDGDRAPLRELVEMKEKYGAWLMVDEAHATGLYGVQRRGVAEELGVANRIEVQMGTLGKALGAAGGYICGPRALIHLLINRARSFIFSTAPPPAAAAAATAGVRFVQSAAGEERNKKLWEHVGAVAGQVRKQKTTSHTERRRRPGAIIPIIIGAENKAVKASEGLWEQGIFVPAIRYPTVARGQARLRITLNATHTAEQIDRLLAALQTSLHVGE